MSMLPYSIAWFLWLATDKESVTVLLNLRSVSFIANTSLFHSKHSIDLCYEGDGLVAMCILVKGTALYKESLLDIN